MIRILLESPRAQHILARLITGPEPVKADWHTTLAEPPDPSPESISIYLEELQRLVLETIPVDSKTLQEYESANRLESYKRYRLLEIVCTAIHFLAIRLYQQYHPPTPFEDPSGGLRLPKPYPRIRHTSYFKYERTGDPKSVGFWAEAQILGGVILFDRGASGEECKSVWLHGKPHHDINEVYKLPDDAVLAILEHKCLPLELVWENLPHLSAADAQRNGIYREFGLAHIKVYRNFLTTCQQGSVNGGEIMERKLDEFLKRNTGATKDRTPFPARQAPYNH
ncbi:hypothetical protein Dda_7059 [Drechslerella dactyloides]|uniref:Uncharacterized protein n=1 Tax=Drechslerella dactyloides TaxID=74499 RepID=A0AAD6NHA5_DREDA|nr:hypothetical protein Dda_7059 [Drechslerella dactyloides]